jgi:uncharacterized protein YjhX (UPF0386 family)
MSVDNNTQRPVHALERESEHTLTHSHQKAIANVWCDLPKLRIQSVCLQKMPANLHIVHELEIAPVTKELRRFGHMNVKTSEQRIPPILLDLIVEIVLVVRGDQRVIHALHVGPRSEEERAQQAQEQDLLGNAAGEQHYESASTTSQCIHTEERWQHTNRM